MTLSPCPCGGTGTLREGHYPEWVEVACSNCDRVEFGREERTVIERWNVLLSPHKANEGPSCGNSVEPSNHENLGKETRP